MVFQISGILQYRESNNHKNRVWPYINEKTCLYAKEYNVHPTLLCLADWDVNFVVYILESRCCSLSEKYVSFRWFRTLLYSSCTSMKFLFFNFSFFCGTRPFWLLWWSFHSPFYPNPFYATQCTGWLVRPDVMLHLFNPLFSSLNMFQIGEAERRVLVLALLRMKDRQNIQGQD